MACMVDSILMTTPFLNPRDACWPSPITFKLPSGNNSATIVTILEVPISSPTIKFLSSRTLFIIHSPFHSLSLLFILIIRYLDFKYLARYAST